MTRERASAEVSRATWLTTRQVRAISDEIVKTLKAAGDPPLGVEGTDEGRWILIDCNDVICHVFGPDAREHYDLERLWRDAEVIDLELPAGAVAEPADEESGDAA